jgi:N-dimethylarginine dimethylaminohydrolase
MCPPDHYGIEYEINPWMHQDVGSDTPEAKRQWHELVSKLRELGATIELMSPVAGLPDLVFTANAGLVFGNLFLVSRFLHGVRQGESPHFAQWAAEHGFQVEELPPGMHHEGAGDALFCGEILFAGYRIRSNAASHHWVGQRLQVEVLPLELIDPRFYHLDTCFCPLKRDEAMYYPGAFDDYGRSVLREHVPHLIEVSVDEAAAFSCNAVVLGGNVILNEGSPKLARALLWRGYTVHTLRFSEFIKSGGSAKCLTLRLDGEDAAAWRTAQRVD